MNIKENIMLIDVRNISKSYKTRYDEINVFENLSFTADKGEFVAITGKSGCGKSTFMRIIGCLESFENGEYFFDGENLALVNNARLAEIRNRKIGYIFQNFSLIPEYTIFENIEVPLGYLGVSKKQRTERVNDLLRTVELTDKAKNYPSQLSGGQQQRIAIARAIANDPELIIADEPTGNLDFENLERIMKTFINLKNNNISIIMVTHDANAAKYADRIIKSTELI